MEVYSPIELPKDEGLVKKLKGKLVEYGKRINDEREKILERNPHIDFNLLSGELATNHSSCKFFILSRLLDRKLVEVDDLFKEYLAESKTAEINLKFREGIYSYFIYCFNNAYKVIKNYCETEGADIKGGTGLSRFF
jgi:hypothetical protein